MANVKISQLSASTTLNGTELIELVQGGNNVQSTVADVRGTTSISSSWASSSISSSYAISASYAYTSSYSLSGSWATSASYAYTTSYAYTSSNAKTASYAYTSSYAANGVFAYGTFTVSASTLINQLINNCTMSRASAGLYGVGFVNAASNTWYAINCLAESGSGGSGVIGLAETASFVTPYGRATSGFSMSFRLPTPTSSVSDFTTASIMVCGF